MFYRYDKNLNSYGSRIIFTLLILEFDNPLNKKAQTKELFISNC